MRRIFHVNDTALYVVRAKAELGREEKFVYSKSATRNLRNFFLSPIDGTRQISVTIILNTHNWCTHEAATIWRYSMHDKFDISLFEYIKKTNFPLNFFFLCCVIIPRRLGNQRNTTERKYILLFQCRPPLLPVCQTTTKLSVHNFSDTHRERRRKSREKIFEFDFHLNFVRSLIVVLCVALTLDDDDLVIGDEIGKWWVKYVCCSSGLFLSLAHGEGATISVKFFLCVEEILSFTM